MKIGIIGAGNIGRTLGQTWAAAGHDVAYGVRTPDDPKHAALTESGAIVALAAAVAQADVLVLSLPGQAVAQFAADMGDALNGKVIIDATNNVGAPVLNRTEDIANARLEFENGAVANITASRVAGKTERRTRIFQPDAYLVCDFGNSQLVRFRRTGDPEKDGINAIGFESWNIPREDSLRNEISEFLDCVSNGRIPTVDGRVGREALRIASMINDSLREHQQRVQAHLAAAAKGDKG